MPSQKSSSRTFRSKRSRSQARRGKKKPGRPRRIDPPDHYLAFEVVNHMRDGKSISEISKLMGRSRQKIASLLHFAFRKESRLLTVHAPVDLALAALLRDAFPCLQDCVVIPIPDSEDRTPPDLAGGDFSHYWFACAKAVLRWLLDWANGEELRQAQRLWAAIGGGQGPYHTQQELASSLQDVYGAFQVRSGGRSPFENPFSGACFLPATLGCGPPDRPQLNASVIACVLGNILRAQQRSYADLWDPRHQAVIRDAAKKVSFVLSGVGAATRETYCISSLDCDPPAGAEGEFLFRFFSIEGQEVPLRPGPKKPNVLTLCGTKLPMTQKARHPAFATLFSTETLQRMASSSTNVVAAVLSESPQVDKTNAVLSLLKARILNRLVLSSRLAEKVVSKHAICAPNRLGGFPLSTF